MVDWQNALIGHMQHNARDPNPDHKHGRIYRVTYPSRPLLKPAKIHGASIDELLKNLELPELRTRHRTRRELRGRDSEAVTNAVVEWSSNKEERLQLEALWLPGAGRLHQPLMKKLLKSSDHRIRVGDEYMLYASSVPDGKELLSQAFAMTAMDAFA